MSGLGRNVARRSLILMSALLISCGLAASITPVASADHTNAYVCNQHWVVGKIKHRYDQISGSLQCPTSDELTNPGNTGKRQHFGPRGNIYWQSGQNNAYSIWGELWIYWGQSGYETGMYRYPSSNEGWDPAAGHYYQWFTGNCWLLAWNPNKGIGRGYVCD